MSTTEIWLTEERHEIARYLRGLARVHNQRADECAVENDPVGMCANENTALALADAARTIAAGRHWTQDEDETDEGCPCCLDTVDCAA